MKTAISIPEAVSNDYIYQKLGYTFRKLLKELQSRGGKTGIRKF